MTTIQITTAVILAFASLLIWFLDYARLRYTVKEIDKTCAGYFKELFEYQSAVSHHLKKLQETLEILATDVSATAIELDQIHARLEHQEETVNEREFD